MRPMLCGSVQANQVETYLNDDNWVAQQKLDGDRLLIHVTDHTVTPLNRDGVRRSNPTPKVVLDQFAVLPGEWVLDGELLTSGEFWLFDLPKAADGIGPTDPYWKRYEVLERVFAGGIWQPADCIRLLPMARTTLAKRRLLRDLHGRGAEGLIFRHMDAGYKPGKRSELALKAKFTHTAEVVVHQVRPDGRDNCTFRLFRDGRLVPAGSVSLVGRPPVAPGDVIEVRYLYASEDSLLYQPVMLRVRHDKAPSECTVDQLFYTDRTVVPLPHFYTYRGENRRGTHVTGTFSGEDPGEFARVRHERRWRSLVVEDEDGQHAGGIQPHPETGRRIWWG